MEAGRELDALVDEKIFGFSSLDLPTDRPPTATECLNRGMMLALIPNYSTDIAAAWEVVEKMRANNFLFTINMSDNFRWECEFDLNDGAFLLKSDTIGFGRSETAPHAICLAALEAVGVEV